MTRNVNVNNTILDNHKTVEMPRVIIWKSAGMIFLHYIFYIQILRKKPMPINVKG